MKDTTLIAILGPSASGKSALALEIAKEIDAEIFSLDSLSIYKEIDIASAKPKKSDLDTIKHYGINELEITEPNNAMVFKNLLDLAIEKTKKQTLLIVGGSSFYLKAMMDGLSVMPVISEKEREAIIAQIDSLSNPYEFLSKIDPLYATSIQPKDTYRISKALEIFFATHTPLSEYFATHPKIALKSPIRLYEIATHREKLKEKISLRTHQMIEEGIIQEIEYLLKKYPKNSQPFKAIGPKECISYLQGEITYEELPILISTHTAQLAKRQSTFNRTQFCNISKLSAKEIYEDILNFLS